ncbi:MAG: winged helix-turn-helix domain-containing protein [Bacilli bacterium]
MKDNQFFKQTPLYKEFLLLDIIEGNSKITQRELSKDIDSSVSMINTYIEDYEKKGYLERKYLSNKNLEYIITKKGIERKRLLSIEYLKASHNIYDSARENILNFAMQIIQRGFKNILLYGAGEVAELLLQVLNSASNIPLNVLAVIDDDLNKQDKRIINYPIISIDYISDIVHDGILISNYSHRLKIFDKLLAFGYKKDNILTFFDI